MPLSIVQVQQSILPTGASTETTLAALSAKLPTALGQTTMAASLAVTLASNQSALAVSGPITDTQLRASAVPISAAGLPLPTGASTETTLAALSAKLPSALGQAAMASSMSVVLASNQSTIPVSIAGTVTVSGTTTDTQLPATLGQKLMAGSTSVTIASDQSAVPVSATALPLPTGAATQATLASIELGIPAALGQTTMVNSMPVVLASDQASVLVTGPQTDAQSRQYAATLGVTASGLAGTSVIATLPAPGAGLFQYITSIKVFKLYSSVGTASGAGVTLSGGNLPGPPVWLTEQAAAGLGTVVKVVDETYPIPLRASVANTAVTVTCPAQAQTTWRVNVSYYAGP